ncbi:MAG TPA: tetratricopeptide repeat protein [Pyrinomonadaceae bacterium]|jgi:tetratricopeptide (TPR) repeat protein|nr:tetratricopeptide repeat protein [Pyrinomonadaceae bacterium]
MARHFFLALVIFAFAAHARPARAQNSERDRDTYNPSTSSVDITGQVRFAGSMSPATGVRVVLEKVGGGTLDQMATDSRGRFHFTSLQRGQYVVNVSAPCYQTDRRQVELIVIFRAYLDVDLAPDTTSPACAAAPAPASAVDARVPEEARREFERGSAALSKGKTEEGVEHLRRAVEIYPDFLQARLLLASAHMKSHRWEDAEAALARAVETDPRSVAALVSLGEARRRLKKYAEAEESLNAALKLDDASWQGHLALGCVYLDTDQVKKAAPHIGRTLQLKPDLAEAHLLGGNILLKVGEPARALSEYEEYLRLAPAGEYAAPTRELVEKLRKTLPEKKDE